MRKGFTLIELSIVLVIIGLIAGGVLFGRDLIANAELRAQVSQMEKLEAAINTFRGKFNALPGDMANASQFGLDQCGPYTGDGDGDGILHYNPNGEGQKLFCNLYNAGFWTHTSSVPYQAFYVGVPAATKNRILVAGANITGMPATYAPAHGYHFLIDADYDAAFMPSFKPTEVIYMDTKMDDGMPNTGKVVGSGQDGSPFSSGAAGTANCIDTGPTPNVYNTTYNATNVCVPAFKIGGYQ